MLFGTFPREGAAKYPYIDILSFLMDKYIGVGWLDHVEVECLTIQESAKPHVFSAHGG